MARRPLTAREIELVAHARMCCREMPEDAEIGAGISAYMRKHDLRSTGGLFGDLVRVIDCYGDHHSDARLIAYANRTPDAYDAAYW